MKKAKIILSAVALMAVVGGAFAFKAQRGLGSLITSYTTTTAVGGPTFTYCSFTDNLTTTADLAAPIRTYYTTINGVRNCPNTFFTSHVTLTVPGN